MKILYFTSTGNCLYVAKRMGGEALSIAQLQKAGVYDITDDAVGIVAPIYGFNVPRPVIAYLNRVKIKADYVFTVMTYGNTAMAAVCQMQKLLENRNITLNYSAELKMVDNYLPLFDIRQQLKSKNNEKIEAAIDKICADVKSRKNELLKKTWLENFASNMLASHYSSEKGEAAMRETAKQFIVNYECNVCGTCRKVCPLNNIAGDGRPEFQDRCESCLACVHNCPKTAIHLKNERSAARFRNQHIELSEIIAANRQSA